MRKAIVKINKEGMKKYRDHRHQTPKADAPPKKSRKGKKEGKKRLTTLAFTKSPNLKQSPILILSLSVNLISANLITPVNSSFDSGTGLFCDIWIWRWAWVGANLEIVPITCGVSYFVQKASAGSGVRG